VNVLLVTHRYPPHGIGGVERYVQTVAAGLAARGDEVTVLTRTPTRWPRRPRLRSRGHLVEIVGAGVRLEQFLVGATDSERLLERIVGHLQPDVVHVNHLIGLSPRVVPIANRAGGAVVWTLHDFFAACPLVHLVKRSGEACNGPREGHECAIACFAEERDGEVRWTLRYRYFAELLRTVDRVLCPSPTLAGWAKRMQPESRTEILPLGVDPATRRTATEPVEGRLRVLHLGNVAPHKGLRLLARAAAVVSPAIVISVAGRVDRRSFRRELDKLSRGRLKWLGPYEPSARSELLEDADVVVALSQVPEAYPLVPREALVHGVPVVATRVPGLVDVIRDGVNGILVDPADLDALLVALNTLLVDRRLLNALREGARASVFTTVDDHVDELRASYEGALHGPRVEEPQLVAFEQLHADALRAGFGRR
jgi:glycosyltransferase involved in cell wall biosynthesis